MLQHACFIMFEALANAKGGMAGKTDKNAFLQVNNIKPTQMNHKEIRQTNTFEYNHH